MEEKRFNRRSISVSSSLFCSSLVPPLARPGLDRYPIQVRMSFIELGQIMAAAAAAAAAVSLPGISLDTFLGPQQKQKSLEN